MIIIWLVIFFILGAAVGSFLNVVADRLPLGRSIVFPASHCPGCKYRLSSRDNIPIFSYLWLKGRCRNCGIAIPKRVFWVELCVGLLFAFLCWHYGLVWELAFAAFFCCIFILLLIIDLEDGILPNKLVYPSILLIVVLAAAGSILGFEPGYTVDLGFKFWGIDVVVGGAIFFGFLFVVVLASRGGMGWGDVKLAALIGLVTGFPLVFVAMFLSFVGGGLIAIILLLLKVKRRRDAIPFGPFMSMAAMVTMFWGKDILNFFLPG